MSEDLVNKFIASIDEDDGFTAKVKRQRSSLDKKKDIVKQVLNAAAKGQISLPDEETFIVEKRDKKKKKTASLNDKWATQGFSLVDQIRAEKPRDLLRRNVKYMKFTEKRKIDPKKASTMLQTHMKSLPNKDIVRSDREKIDCLRAPKRVLKKNKSVFSDKDFDSMKKTPKKLKRIQGEDGCFL